MGIYIILIAFVIIISFLSLDKRIKNDYHLFFSIIFIIILSVIAGGRVMGYDFVSYYKHFERVPEIMNYERTDYTIELGYELLVSLFKSFSDSFNGYLFFYAFFTMILACVACFKYSSLPLLSFGMFFSYCFFFQVMGQMRQPFAILTMYIILIPLMLKKKYFWATAVILASTVLLHKSCFLAILIFVFKDRLIRPKTLVMIFCGIIILYVLSSVLVNLMIALIPKSFYLYDAIVTYTSSKSIQVGFTLGMLERIGMFFIMYYFSYKYGIYQNNQKIRLFLNLYLTGIVIYFSFISIAAEFATRGTFFYIYSIFFILPNLITEIPCRNVKYTLCMITLLWSMYIASGIVRDTENNEEYIPYKSVIY